MWAALFNLKLMGELVVFVFSILLANFMQHRISLSTYSLTKVGEIIKKRGRLLQVQYQSGNGANFTAWVDECQPYNGGGSEETRGYIESNRLSVAEAAEADSDAQISAQAYMTSALSVVVVGASGDLVSLTKSFS